MTLQTDLEKIYPTCYRALSTEIREKLIALADAELDAAAFPKLLTLEMESLPMPDYLPDLARLEWAIYDVQNSDVILPAEADDLSINPTLVILELSWKNLPLLVRGDDSGTGAAAESGPKLIVI